MGLRSLIKSIGGADATGQGPGRRELITIVVPQFVPRRWWHNLLHTQAAVMLRVALLFKPGITVTDVPYQIR